MTPVRDTKSIDHAAKAPATKDADGVDKDIKKAAAQFEAILVRQMLQSASVAGKGSYADMGVEALSTAVTSGGGLGLGRAIEHAVGKAHPHASVPAELEAPKKATTAP